MPGGFYIALVMRWARLGFRTPKSQNRQFDPDYQQALIDEVIEPIVKSYFEAEVELEAQLSPHKSAIVVLNHAGMCFPWDFLALAYLLNRDRGWAIEPLAHLALFSHPWMLWWFPVDWARVLGAIPAEKAALESALNNGKVVLYAPEGVRGPGKGWKNRDRLQTFDPAFIRLSQEYRVPILPVVCLGSEGLHPWAINLPRVADRLKLPVFPVSPLMILLGLFPSMGVWAAKTRLRYYMQPMLDFNNEEKQLSTSQAYRKAQELRLQMQAILDLKSQKLKNE